MRKARVIWVVLIVIFCTEAQSADNGNVFWQVKSKSATVYLLGSIHIAREDAYPLDPVIENAFSASDYLAVECDISKVDQAEAIKMAFYNDGTTLKDHVSKQWYDTLMVNLEREGLPAESFIMMKPFFVVTMIMVNKMELESFSASLGIDKHFLNNKGRKPVLEVESVKEQLAIIDGFTTAQNDMFIKYSFLEGTISGDNFNELYNIWKEGNIKKLEEEMIGIYDKYPGIGDIFHILLDKRNINMVKKIEEYLSSTGTYFVVVGAAHLIGSNGIVGMLEKRKEYEVERK